MENEHCEWNVIKVEGDEYKRQTAKLKNVFNKAEFCETNRDKVDDIWYLLVRRRESIRFAMAVGIRGTEIYCPFSAPFGYPEEIKDGMSVEEYSIAGTLLDQYFKASNITRATIYFPPSFYDEKAIETWMNIFFYLGWRVETIDLSFGFHIPNIIDDYENKIEYSGKKNFRISQNAGLSFAKCENLEDKKEAYRIISVNRASKGYPLRMSEKHVLETMAVVPSSMYIVSCGEENVASALVYDVTSKAAQVVYWGDIPGHAEKKVINYLAYELLKVYNKRGFEYLDIGPATENGIPSFGLCRFKDTIGCERTTKYRLSKTYSD